MSNFLQSIHEVASQIEWSSVVYAASSFLSLVGGAAAVPYITKIKNHFKLGPRLTQFLVVCVSVGISIATLIVNNVLVPQAMTVDHLFQLLVLVLIASQAEYWRIVKNSTVSAIEPATE